MAVKGFITLAPDVNDRTLFCPLTETEHINRVVAPTKHLQTSLIIEVKTQALYYKP
jgi:hypothetical protein